MCSTVTWDGVATGSKKTMLRNAYTTVLKSVLDSMTEAEKHNLTDKHIEEVIKKVEKKLKENPKFQHDDDLLLILQTGSELARWADCLNRRDETGDGNLSDPDETSRIIIDALKLHFWKRDQMKHPLLRQHLKSNFMTEMQPRLGSTWDMTEIQIAANLSEVISPNYEYRMLIDDNIRELLSLLISTKNLAMKLNVNLKKFQINAFIIPVSMVAVFDDNPIQCPYSASIGVDILAKCGTKNYVMTSLERECMDMSEWMDKLEKVYEHLLASPTLAADVYDSHRGIGLVFDQRHRQLWLYTYDLLNNGVELKIASMLRPHTLRSVHKSAQNGMIKSRFGFDALDLRFFEDDVDFLMFPLFTKERKKKGKIRLSRGDLMKNIQTLWMDRDSPFYDAEFDRFYKTITNEERVEKLC